MKTEPSPSYAETMLISISRAIMCGLLAALLFAFSHAAYPQERVSITVNVAASLDGLPKEQIFALRKSEVEKHRELGIFPKNYEPSSRVFGQM